MKKWIKFFGITLWIVGTRAYDAYSTYLYTPDLSLENNPLVSWLRLDWTPLLIVIGGLLIYIIYAIHVSIFRVFRFAPEQPGFSFVRFTTYLYQGRDEHWSTIFYKFPQSTKRFHHYMGHLLGRALVFAGLVSTLMWLGIWYSEWYHSLHSARMIYLILIVGCLAIILYWNWQRYQAYQTRLKVD